MLRPRLCCRLALASAVLGAFASLAGCTVPPPKPATSGRQIGLAEVLERPAERALLNGKRHYDEGNYADAEKSLKTALSAGLVSAKDRAQAHKLLAFIYCTSERPGDCEASFRAARAADPGFVLSRSESGHPLWGPVYRRTLP